MKTVPPEGRDADSANPSQQRSVSTSSPATRSAPNFDSLSTGAPAFAGDLSGVEPGSFRIAISMWFIVLVAFVPIGLYIHFSENIHPSMDVLNDVVFVAVVLCFVKPFRACLAEGLRWRRIPLKSLAWILPLFGLLYAVVWRYFAVIELLGVPFVRYLESYDEAGWPFWSAVLTICVVPAVFEEIACRGILFHGLREVCSVSEALILQAVLFAVLHLMPVVFPSHFAIGLVLGLIAWKTKSLWPAMVLHFVWNLGVLLLEKFA